MPILTGNIWTNKSVFIISKQSTFLNYLIKLTLEMKNLSLLLTLSILLISCGGVQNASEDALVNDTLSVINEAEFIQQYVQFRNEVLEKGKEVKTRFEQGRLNQQEHDELMIAYGNTKEVFNSILDGMVMDLVLNIDKIAKNKTLYRDKYTMSFKDAIAESQSTDDFLGLFAMYDDTDSAVLGVVVSIIGPVVLDGIRGFVRNSKKFQNFSRKRLSPPVIKRFGFPEFENLH